MYLLFLMICPSIRKTKLNTRAFVRELPDVQLLKGVQYYNLAKLCTLQVTLDTIF